MKKILLIGGGGYIGSYFNLKTSKKYIVDNITFLIFTFYNVVFYDVYDSF